MYMYCDSNNITQRRNTCMQGGANRPTSFIKFSRVKESRKAQNLDRTPPKKRDDGLGLFCRCWCVSSGDSEGSLHEYEMYVQGVKHALVIPMAVWQPPLFQQPKVKLLPPPPHVRLSHTSLSKRRRPPPSFILHRSLQDEARQCIAAVGFNIHVGQTTLAIGSIIAE